MPKTKKTNEDLPTMPPKAQPKKTVDTPENWFVTGVDGIAKKKQLDKSAEMRREKLISRFFLREKESAIVVFLDSIGHYCLVHQLEIGGSWRNFFTCVRDYKPCPVCEHVKTLSSKSKSLVYCGHYSIIRQGYTDAQGNVIKAQKMLLPAKKQMIDKVAELAIKYKDKGGLVGLAVKLTRYDGEPNCGGTLEVLKKIDLAKQFPDIKDFKPFDYRKVLAPPTEDELEALGFSSAYIAGSSADIGTGNVLDELI